MKHHPESSESVLTNKVAHQLVADIHRYGLEFLDVSDTRRIAVHQYPEFVVYFSAIGGHPYMQKLRWLHSNEFARNNIDQFQVEPLVNAALLTSETMRQKTRGLQWYPQIQRLNVNWLEWELTWWKKSLLPAPFQEEGKTLTNELKAVADLIDGMEQDGQWRQIPLPPSYIPENFRFTLDQWLSNIRRQDRIVFSGEIELEVDPSVPATLRVRFQQ